MPFAPDPNSIFGKEAAKVCPKCGTTDCIPKARIRIEGAGVMRVDSNELAKSCKFRQQVRQAREIVIHTRNRGK